MQLAVAALALAARLASDTLAITDVTVLPMDRLRVLEHQTVVIADGRIIALGPSKDVRTPAGARVIDGSGKYLMPGLADMHVHITTPDELPMYVGNGVLHQRRSRVAPR
jgi:imidazolonepropionase-like amidohydrolase